jgi:hypothetical protein
MGAWQPRQQAAKPSAGVSVKIVFAVSSVVSVRRNVACEMEAVQK